MATVEKALSDGEGTMGSIEGTVERKEAPIMLFLPKKKKGKLPSFFVKVQTRERERASVAIRAEGAWDFMRLCYPVF